MSARIGHLGLSGQHAPSLVGAEKGVEQETVSWWTIPRARTLSVVSVRRTRERSAPLKSALCGQSGVSGQSAVPLVEEDCNYEQDSALSLKREQ